MGRRMKQEREQESIQTLIDRRLREVLNDMGEATPREREALAGAVEKLLRAKPLAGDHGLNLLDILRNVDKETDSK